MKRSAEAAWERAMKVQEVILRAITKQITWWQAAEIIGLSDQQFRRWQRRYEEHGYTGLLIAGVGASRKDRYRWPQWKRCCSCTESNTSTSTCGTFTRS
jgi:transposase